MRQTLETQLYGIPRFANRERVYTIVDLEYLSASALYSSGPLGGSGPLTIRPFSGFDLHIHEGAGGSANIKYPDGSHTLLDSYDAAMADLLADNLGILKYLKTDKSERRGRI